MGTQIKKCTIISGAPDDDIDFLKENIDVQSFIICADSGYKNCLKAGFTPNLIIGDFDSSEKPDIDCEIISLEVEKAYTDTFHCVMEAVDRGYNEVQIFCAIGSRLDHTYSNILSLDYCQKHGVKCSIQTVRESELKALIIRRAFMIKKQLTLIQTTNLHKAILSAKIMPRFLLTKAHFF